MAKDENRLRKIAEEYKQKLEEKDDRLLTKYPGKVSEFLRLNGWNDNYNNTGIVQELADFLRDSSHKPSEFWMPYMKMGWVDESLHEDLIYCLDNVCSWQISDSHYRRSLRGSRYDLYIDKYVRIIKGFHRVSGIGEDILSIMKGELPEEKAAYIRYGMYSQAEDEYLIAARIHNGDKELIQYLLDQIYEEGGHLSYLRIRAIMMSGNTELLEALGKLLLAARLQEGVRQSICENMDCGCMESFTCLFKIIMDNNLIRYPSVMRAAATWTGLLSEESSDNDRISRKQVGLIGDYIADEDARSKALESEDSMEIYLALWSYGTTDVCIATNKVIELCIKGSRHQRMVALYYLNTMDLPFSEHQIAKSVVRYFNEEQDVMALAMRSFMGDSYDYMWKLNYGGNRYSVLASDGLDERLKDGRRVYADADKYFADEEECRLYYDIMKEMLLRLQKRKVEFDPCIFLWNKEELSKSALLLRMAICASALKDNELIDEVVENLSLVGEGSFNYDRCQVLLFLLIEPQTKKQWEALTLAVADAESQTREWAYRILRSKKLPDECYSLLEEMLKYKKADVREHVIDLLDDLKDEDKLALVERLLADKKVEKRTAGLDFVLRMKQNPSKKKYFDEMCTYVKNMEKPTTKEEILIKEILEETKENLSADNGYGIYDVNCSYEPAYDQEYIEEGRKLIADMFPDSVIAQNDKGPLKKLSGKLKKLERLSEELAVLKKLDDLIEDNKELEYPNWNGSIMNMLANSIGYYNNESGERVFAFSDLWDDFYEKNLHDYKAVLKLKIWMNSSKDPNKGYQAYFADTVAELLGEEMNHAPELKYENQINQILIYLEEKHRDIRTLHHMSAAVSEWMIVNTGKLVYKWSEKRYLGGTEYERSILTHLQLQYFFFPLSDTDEDFEYLFPIYYGLMNKVGFVADEYSPYYIGGLMKLGLPDACTWLKACDMGMISKDFMYSMLMNANAVSLRETLNNISELIKYIRENKKAVATRQSEGIWRQRKRNEMIRKLYGNAAYEESFHPDDSSLTALVNEVYETLVRTIMDVELVRGDTPTVFSKDIFALRRVYGVDYFVRILSALGKETLERSKWFDSGYYKQKDASKKESLSHLLMACVPDEDDDAGALRKRIKNTDIDEKRLVEAALYSPEWMGIVGDYLGWEGFTSGCYYFMAHMNETFDDKRTAMIAKYTPISIDELSAGAFDLNWFNEVYKTLGGKHFDMLYQAAKYISDGAKHTRARKYADAVNGKLDKEKTEKEIEAKRNKDLLMAYALIPLKKNEDTKRYLFIQKYIKESRQFGAQRRASERIAADIAIKNLAVTAGYTDTTRFILKMEASVASELQKFFTPYPVEDVYVSLNLTADNKLETICTKDDKRLKNIPARLKKNEYIISLKEAGKTLTEQARRTKQMLEEAMEEETVFTIGELRNMMESPIAAAIVDKLVLKVNDEDRFVFVNSLSEENDGKGNLFNVGNLPDDTEVLIAHPYHMYKAKKWREIEQYIFDNKIRQPFKQVFRELYVKTEEERNSGRSMRYSGNQIQVKQTIGCLKGRRWVCDAENGLQKVFYKENIIAGIYALADWFSPADIEAPTLEWVVFTDRKTFKEIPIKNIPDVLFSEVMRDVDLAVSVAHAGEVDPEMSHSTVEMRKAIVEFTLPLFKLSNVTLTDSHAIIEGTRAKYTVHLGSGVIHQMNGPMINVLPVHSQHRGRIFLPFVDDDPKTSEIISKILLFAEDGKIKDPFILEQIEEE